MTNIRYTRHGATRMQQRGITETDVEIVLRYGTVIDDMAVILRRRDEAREVGRLKRQIRRGGLSSLHIRRCRREIRALERNRGRKIVLIGDRLVTAYRPRRTDQKRALRTSRTKGHTK